MVAVLKQNATKEQIENLSTWLESRGLKVHISVGEFHTIVGLVGDTSKIDIELLEGLDMIESVQPEAAGMNPYELKRKYGDKLGFFGCLGNQSTIPYGTPDEIFAEVRKLKKEMSVNGGYILAPAKPLSVETPVENAVAVLEAFTEM